MTKQNTRAGFSNIIVGLIIATILLGVASLIGYYGMQKSGTENSILSDVVDVPPFMNIEEEIQYDQDEKFKRGKAQQKLYYSEALGIEFDYLPMGSAVTITEQNNTIYVQGSSLHSIEVFTKEPEASLEQAIADRFLKDFNPVDCFVVTYTNSWNQRVGLIRVRDNYVAAGISFPLPDEPYEAWWGVSHCPYRETNSMRYFLMNKSVPSKFLFLELGQECFASDGRNGCWYESVRIIR